MKLPNALAEPLSVISEYGSKGSTPMVPLSAEPNSSMGEYHRLREELLITTLALIGVIFFCVWFFYSWHIALNYLLGACTGVVYLRMLAKDVEQLGREKNRLSKARFAVFIAAIIVGTQWDQLRILPIFLGFLTYKAALIVYIIRTAVFSD